MFLLNLRHYRPVYPLSGIQLRTNGEKCLSASANFSLISSLIFQGFLPVSVQQIRFVNMDTNCLRNL